MVSPRIGSHVDITGTLKETAARVVPLMVEKGWPRDQAQLSVDLAIHAMNEAERVTIQVCARAENYLTSAQATCLATEFIIKRMEQIKATALQLIEEASESKDV